VRWPNHRLLFPLNIKLYHYRKFRTFNEVIAATFPSRRRATKGNIAAVTVFPLFQQLKCRRG
jgi:hypothetical protein